ncbi:hypothetical protein [Caenibacillus caldisaponilyticus]|uniref:hypothetical protein n=1 Tax=Caenibacillus caldisaponilyticus TaxID=1674942 RepID=UPI0009883AB7|nr:hypothetical protein [Caenibacillus caldisaponilyticus]
MYEKLAENLSGVRVIKDIHETEKAEEFQRHNDDELYSPIEDLQRIAGGGPLKRSSFNIQSFPKGIKLLGYFFIGFMAAAFLLVVIFNLLD